MISWKRKYLERNLSQWHFVHHRSSTDKPGTESEPLVYFTEIKLTPDGCWMTTGNHETAVLVTLLFYKLNFGTGKVPVVVK